MIPLVEEVSYQNEGFSIDYEASGGSGSLFGRHGVYTRKQSLIPPPPRCHSSHLDCGSGTVTGDMLPILATPEPLVKDLTAALISNSRKGDNTISTGAVTKDEKERNKQRDMEKEEERNKQRDMEKEEERNKQRDMEKEEERNKQRDMEKEEEMNKQRAMEKEEERDKQRDMEKEEEREWEKQWERAVGTKEKRNSEGERTDKSRDVLGASSETADVSEASEDQTNTEKPQSHRMKTHHIREPKDGHKSSSEE
ncbi:unnamed protein product [Oncorhynchus mykiss]|uniref:Uncharacterized protein n=1 Tax=Oncorhynchus mykiss TaxID=8022 RepID=A0A060WBR7_ONCMY|nr:unnamed protein product [Oncorhynchus mykiss]